MSREPLDMCIWDHFTRSRPAFPAMRGLMLRCAPQRLDVHMWHHFGRAHPAFPTIWGFDV